MNSEKVVLCAFADEADGSLDGQIEALKANGISQLEIRFVDKKNIVSLAPDEAKEIKAKLDANGISVWSLGSPIGKIKITDDFDAELERYRKMIEVGKILGAKCVRIFSFYGTNGDSKYFDEICARLKKYVEIANEYGIIPCHENEKGIYGDIPERCLEIHKALPEMPAIFDPANYIQCGADTLKAWEIIKGFVKYLHIKDALPNGSVVPAGKGIGNLPFILDDFRKNGGKCVTIEPHLTVFSGLAALEKEGDKSVVGEVYRYPSNTLAFKAAADALKELI